MTRSFQQAHHTLPVLRVGVQAGQAPAPPTPSYTRSSDRAKQHLSLLFKHPGDSTHLPGWGASVSRTWQWEECERVRKKPEFSDRVLGVSEQEEGQLPRGLSRLLHSPPRRGFPRYTHVRAALTYSGTVQRCKTGPHTCCSGWTLPRNTDQKWQSRQLGLGGEQGLRG